MLFMGGMETREGSEGHGGKGKVLLALALVSLFVAGLTWNGAVVGISTQGLCLLALLAIAGGLWLYKARPAWLRNPNAKGEIWIGLLAVGGTLTLLLVGISVTAWLGIGAVALLGMAIYWKCCGTLTLRRVLLLLFLAGLLLRVAYVLYTPYTMRQHDSYAIGNSEGHLAYIQYFLDHGLALPDFDPREVFQFYHPPLHHILAALWVKLNTLLGVGFTQAVENIQALTLFYTSCATLCIYRIFQEFELRGKGLAIAWAITCFFPTFLLLSGYLNNDALCVMLMLATLLYAIRWYKRPSMRGILCIAVALGLGMMAKTNAAILAPALALLFLLKLIEDRGKLGTYIKQYLVFLAVCVPLGLWWSIYGYLRFGMPLGYVPLLSSGVGQYIGDYGVVERLFGFSGDQLRSVFVTWENPREHTIGLALLKGAVFGEYNLEQTCAAVALPAKVLFYTNIALVVNSIIATVYVLGHKLRQLSAALKVFLAAVYACVFGSYVMFCFSYPHICTMDFRYIVPTFLFGALATGLALQHADKKWWTRGTAVVVAVYCLCSALVYTLLGSV